MTVVSPHFDDVPLSLGQSLLDGALSRCRVRVRVVFGRTNWTNWVHPTASRAAVISWWRRGEESLASRTFGYRYTAAGWPEALLRWGTAGGERLLDETADLSAEPLIGEIAEWLRAVAAPGSPPAAPSPGASESARASHSSAAPELVLVPAGLGGHVDHRIVALAAASVAPSLPVALGFYEDRPYVAYLDDRTIRDQLAPLGLDLSPRDVSGPIRATTHRRVRRCYPSQIDPYFTRAMDRDLAAGAVERVWFPSGRAPGWFA